MNLLENRTQELWMSFAPKIKLVPNRKGEERFSLQIYPQGYFDTFHPSTHFTKWAAVELSEKTDFEGLETLILEEGLYAVFEYKGLPSDPSIFQFIYSEWLPNSGYSLAERPQFEVLGSKYQNGSPNSEEEIWIPIG